MPTRKWFFLVVHTIATVVVPVTSLYYVVKASLGYSVLLDNELTLTHWQHALNDQVFYLSLTFSLAVGVASTAIVVFLALYFTPLTRTAKPLFRGLPLFTLSLPAIVLAFAVYHVFAPVGLLSRILVGSQLLTSSGQFPALVQSPASTGVLLAHAGLGTPVFILLFTQTSRTYKLDELYKLSRSLGSSKLRYLLTIALPICVLNNLAAIGIFFIYFCGTYEIALLLGPSHPPHIAPYVTDKIQGYDLTQIPEAYASAIMLLCILLGLAGSAFFLNRRYALQ